MSEWNPPQPKMSDLVRRPRAPVLIESKPGPNVSRVLLRKVTNLVVHVPPMDWAEVSIGAREMFRCFSRIPHDPEHSILPEGTETPRPVLIWSRTANRSLTTPAILLEHRMEPLGSITPEDLEAEGFEFLPAFRYRWKQRYPRAGWRPWAQVNVFKVRPWVPSDDAWIGQWLLKQLYGDWRQDGETANQE